MDGISKSIHCLQGLEHSAMNFRKWRAATNSQNFRNSYQLAALKSRKGQQICSDTNKYIWFWMQIDSLFICLLAGWELQWIFENRDQLYVAVRKQLWLTWQMLLWLTWQLWGLPRTYCQCTCPCPCQCPCPCACQSPCPCHSTASKQTQMLRNQWQKQKRLNIRTNQNLRAWT